MRIDSRVVDRLRDVRERARVWMAERLDDYPELARGCRSVRDATGRIAATLPLPRFSLRWKILLAVVLAPLTLAAGTVWTVNRQVAARATTEIQGDLQRAALIFERTLEQRRRALESAAQVVVHDPRFFSAVALPASAKDASYRRTVRGVAADFDKVANADVFEVLDRRGGLVASIGTAQSSTSGREWLVEAAQRGEAATGLLVERGRQYQVTLTPVVVSGRTVGALVLGAEIGGALARELQVLTRSDVTFVSDKIVTGTTFASLPDVDVLLRSTATTAQDAKTFEFERVHAGDETYLTVTREIPGARAGSPQIYVMQRSLDVETAYLQQIQATLLQLGLLAFAFALLIGHFVSKRITRPILEVVRGAEEMERGNYDHPIAVGEKDEIGYLAHRFQEMRRHERVYVNSLQEVARQKSDWVSVASHELKTPVSIIQGFSEMLVDGVLGRLTKKQKEACKAIHKSTEALVDLAEQANQMSQIDGERITLYREPQDIERLAEEAAGAALAEAVGRHVEVIVGAEPDLETAEVDGPRILQAIMQLVRNGIRFTEDGGKVEVFAKRVGERVEISVRDTGIGIAEDRLPHLFDKVFSVRGAAHHHSSSTLEFNSAGLGLGLAIAHGIAEAHGGSINVESQLGQGSCFTLRIPLAEEGSAAA